MTSAITAPPARGSAESTSNRILGLRAVLAFSLVVSGVHYVDNTVRWHHYVAEDPSFPGSLIHRWVVPASGVIFVGLAVLAYRSFLHGRYRRAAGYLGAYSISGLVGMLHYVDVAPSDFDAFQNVFVVLDAAAGVAAAAFAVHLARRPPTLDRSSGGSAR